MGSDDEESTSSVATSSVATSSMAEGSSSSTETAKKEDLKQASDKEIADIKKDMSPEEIKEMDAMLGDLSPECAGAFMALEVEEDSDPSEFMNSECFGEFKEANRPDGLTETCKTAYDEAFDVMKSNVSGMSSCGEKFGDMDDDEEPTSEMMEELAVCMKVIEDIESSSKEAEECDDKIKLPWSDMDENQDDRGYHHEGPNCDMNDDGEADKSEMDMCHDKQGPDCDFNQDGKVDDTEEEQCHQEGPDCDFNKDGDVDESEGMKCMEELMKGMCDMDQDGTVSEEEKMECDKMMEEPMDVETKEVR
jgi:hypothetical protein